MEFDRERFVVETRKNVRSFCAQRNFLRQIHVNCRAMVMRIIHSVSRRWYVTIVYNETHVLLRLIDR